MGDPHSPALITHFLLTLPPLTPIPGAGGVYGGGARFAVDANEEPPPDAEKVHVREAHRGACGEDALLRHRGQAQEEHRGNQPPKAVTLSLRAEPSRGGREALAHIAYHLHRIISTVHLHPLPAHNRPRE
jgi:hypothetical protein